MRIIVGLGNPGQNYKDTRHNAGFMAVDHLVNQLGLAWEQNKKFNARMTSPSPRFNFGEAGQPPPSQGEGERSKIIYVKPQTFMNNSGQAVQAVLSYCKLLPKKFGLIASRGSDLSEILTVIHDDLDIELGKYKISVDSRSAGHQGVESIINRLKTKNFKRIRVGIRTDMVQKIPAEKFVLQKFSQEELRIINQVIAEIVESA